MGVDDLKIKLFADGADLAGMMEMYADPKIKGFTTNPTLMNKAGVADYEAFSRDLLAKIPDRPVSLEVFADDLAEMERQARKIASWGDNVNVKIPVSTTTGESTAPIIKTLAAEGVVLNITAIFTHDQVREVGAALDGDETRAGGATQLALGECATGDEASRLDPERRDAQARNRTGERRAGTGWLTPDCRSHLLHQGRQGEVAEGGGQRP